LRAERSLAFALLLLGLPAAVPAEDGALARTVAALLAEPEYASAHWGIEVRRISTGEVLYAHNAEKSLQPASTLKVVTTAAALDLLGPDRRPSTTLESAGRVDAAGRLLGDLYLVGGGDPMSRRYGDPLTAFTALAEALRDAGVRGVEGRLIGYEGYFDPERRPEGWDWDDLVWWYGAEVSALSFHDNSADLQAAPGGRVGDPLIVSRNPESAYYEVTSTAVTGPPRAEVELELTRELGSNRIQLSGTYPRRSRPWKGSVALERPARYAASVFRDVLARHGISVTGDVETTEEPLPESRRVLARFDGPPVSRMIREVNKESVNLHAELLLRQLGVAHSGRGSTEGGREAVEAFLDRANVDHSHWVIRDGSGLSEGNLVTPHGLVTLLLTMDRHPKAEVFRQSLAVGGIDGTLAYRLRSQGIRGRILAKTGTLSNVHGLVGFATRSNGERLAFAILLNNYGGERGTRAVDRIATALLR
jgi:D-alanyl-D-alanine carboxypeptidase/D-alanyl-D-alanine-endopeptidase (penicillin-binding protein 4)